MINTGEQYTSDPLDGFTGDLTPPLTSATLSPQSATGIYDQPVTISLYAVDNPDGEGVVLTLYSLNGGLTFQEYAGSFTVANEGNHSIVFYSIDGAGNVEETKTVRFIINTVPALPNAAPRRNYFVTPTPILSWGRVSWAAEYEIVVDETPSFALPLVFTAVVPADVLGVTTSPLPDGTYYWRVRARDGSGVWGPWSAVDSFVVDAP